MAFDALTEAELVRCSSFAQKYAREHPLPDKAIRIDPADLPAPKTEAEVKAELDRQAACKDTIEFFGPNGTTRIYKFQPDGRFRRVPPLLARSRGPRRTATTSRRRPGGRRRATVRSAASSRDGPSEEPPLAVIPPDEFRRVVHRALGGAA